MKATNKPKLYVGMVPRIIAPIVMVAKTTLAMVSTLKGVKAPSFSIV